MNLFPRKIIKKIEEWLDKPEIIVLLGARQVGKTSIMQLLMQKLKSEEYLFFDLEDTYNLSIFSNIDKFIDYLKIQQHGELKPIKVFVDEFQYLPQPAKFLKLVHDHYPQIKLIISGSSSFELQSKFTDALTGRKIVFNIYPLSFDEYLIFSQSEFADIKQEITLNKIITDYEKVYQYNVITPKLVPVMENFIIWGGFPLPSLTPELSVSFKTFITKFSPEFAIVITKDYIDKVKFHNTDVFFIPLWMV